MASSDGKGCKGVCVKEIEGFCLVPGLWLQSSCANHSVEMQGWDMGLSGSEQGWGNKELRAGFGALP